MHEAVTFEVSSDITIVDSALQEALSAYRCGTRAHLEATVSAPATIIRGDDGSIC
jgi:hypothetical protein